MKNVVTFQGRRLTKIGKKLLLITGVMSCCFSSYCTAANFINEEDSDEYRLSRVIVEADRYKTYSQKAVLTGGDVTVISREDIENRHFSDIKEALLSVPGVTVSDPGYRAQAYQESTYASQTIRVNGDNRVLVLVDGKRMDVGINSASSTRSRTNLSMLTGIDNIERIEIIKGQGALAYGSDATSVVNIITRKGNMQSKTTVSAGMGSWGNRTFRLSKSGMIGNWKFFAGFSQERSGDTKYRDAYLDKVVTFKNSSYNDKNAFISLSRELDENHEIALSYSHQSTKDHFPICALDYEHSYVKGQSNLASWYPGYRNMFEGDQEAGVYTTTLINDVDATYTFMKDKDIPSYVRLYRTYHHYYEMDGVGWTPTDVESGAGGEIQYGKYLKDKDILLVGAEIKHNKYHYNEGAQKEGQDPSEFYQMWSERRDMSAYIQDKIQVSDKWIVTPGVRYNYYGEINRHDTEGKNDTYGSYHHTTFGLFTNYSINKNTDMYASWSQLFNPPFSSDIRKNKDIKPERGNLYTVGLKHRLSEQTDMSISYGYSDVKDSILRYSYLNPNYDPKTMKPREKWNSRSSNVNLTKSSISVELNHKFSSHWDGSISYVHFSTKQDVPVNNEYSTEDQAYQHWYPQNMFKMNFTYHDTKWDAALYGTLYTGADRAHFSNDKFLIWDAHINYHLDKEQLLYVKLMNISNIAYETKASAWGIGAFPQPARRFMFGYEYNF